MYFISILMFDKWKFTDGTFVGIATPNKQKSSGGEEELIVGATWPSQSKTIKTRYALQVGEQYLNLLPLPSAKSGTLGSSMQRRSCGHQLAATEKMINKRKLRSANR
jgi:hypothetical protein